MYLFFILLNEGTNPACKDIENWRFIQMHMVAVFNALLQSCNIIVNRFSRADVRHFDIKADRAVVFVPLLVVCHSRNMQQDVLVCLIFDQLIHKSFKSAVLRGNPLRSYDKNMLLVLEVFTGFVLRAEDPQLFSADCYIFTIHGVPLLSGDYINSVYTIPAMLSFCLGTLSSSTQQKKPCHPQDHFGECSMATGRTWLFPIAYHHRITIDLQKGQHGRSSCKNSLKYSMIIISWIFRNSKPYLFFFIGKHEDEFPSV